MADLSKNTNFSIPKTEGIKYAGSKLKLIPYILDITHKLKPKTILDGFTGTTRVAQAFAQSGYHVTTNDRSLWSSTFAKCYLQNTRDKAYYAPLLEHLNNLPPQDGWFTEYYGGSAHTPSSIGLDGLKKPWQLHNTRRLDAMRSEIDKLGLPDIEKAVLITSLINALDGIDNTMGHYAAYLNTWSPRSYKTLNMKVPALLQNSGNHQVHCKDIFDILPDTHVDLAYYDPPYGSNNEKMPPSRVRYAAYYHLWTTVCLNDKPQLFGKALRRSDTSDNYSPSIFEDFRRGESGRFVVVEALEKLIINTQARYIILSYSSGGRATAQEISDVINQHGQLIAIEEIDYKQNVMATMRWTHEWIREAEQPHREFLFVIQK
jgi:adenine-specific DNA-methyltransferase